MALRVGCGGITWRQFEVPREAVLRDIHEAGYDGSPWYGSGPGTPAEVARDIRSLFTQYGLAPAPAYRWANLWETEGRDDAIADIARYAEISHDLGVDEMYIAAGGFDTVMRSGRTRRQAAAHAGPDDQLTDEEFQRLAEGLNRLGAATLEHGVRICYHNHVGTVVETEEEIERLLALVDPDLVFLGPDIGHLAWAGVDVTAFCQRHAPRILTMHIKDIRFGVRDKGRELGWDYRTFSDNGVFAEIGEGDVDFPALLSVLSSAGLDGWVIVETDVTARATALESAIVSRDNLRKLGV